MSPAAEGSVRRSFARYSGGSASTASGDMTGQRSRVPGARKIVTAHLAAFSRQIGAMLSAGMPIVAALETLEEQADHASFKIVISRVRKSIENGASVSEALQQFPSVFDELYVNMIKGGEKGGQLAEAIGRLAGFLESSAKLRRKVKSAMMYPVIVLCLALGIATAMILFIVPVFGEMFEDFGAELPGPTQLLLNMSGCIRRYGLLILAVIVISVVLFKKWKATPAGAYSFDMFTLRLPILGELRRKVASARFARTLGQLIRSGVPIMSALEVVSGATANKVSAKIVLNARLAVERGEALSSAMLNQPVFPMIMVRMLQVGEKTGSISEMMDNIAEFYEDEVDTMLSGLTSLLEPLLIVFLGIIIGGIVLCMFLPIFKMGEIVSG